MSCDGKCDGCEHEYVENSIERYVAKSKELDEVYKFTSAELVPMIFPVGVAYKSTDDNLWTLEQINDYSTRRLVSANEHQFDSKDELLNFLKEIDTEDSVVTFHDIKADSNFIRLDHFNNQQ